MVVLWFQEMLGNPAGGPNSVDYLVVAGGGGGHLALGGGGAGGFREVIEQQFLSKSFSSTKGLFQLQQQLIQLQLEQVELQ
jgi:hypothetical protein